MEATNDHIFPIIRSDVSDRVHLDQIKRTVDAVHIDPYCLQCLSFNRSQVFRIPKGVIGPEIFIVSLIQELRSLFCLGDSTLN